MRQAFAVFEIAVELCLPGFPRGQLLGINESFAVQKIRDYFVYVYLAELGLLPGVVCYAYVVPPVKPELFDEEVFFVHKGASASVSVIMNFHEPFSVNAFAPLGGKGFSEVVHIVIGV